MHTGALLKKHRNLFFGIVFTVFMILFAVATLQTGYLDFLENKLIDLRFSAFNQEQSVADSIVYIDIDEISLQSLSNDIGGWPWPRGTIVGDHIVDYIMQGDPALLMFDILYVDYSSKSPDVEIPEEDLILLDYSLLYPKVSHAVHFETVRDLEENQVMPEYMDINFALTVSSDDGSIPCPEFNSFVLPYSPLDAYSGSIHSVNFLEDPDGVSRAYNFVYAYDDKLYPSLALKAIMQLEGHDSVSISKGNLILETGGEARRTIKVNKEGAYPINFYSVEKLNDMEQYPADNIIASSFNAWSGLEPLVPQSAFTGKIVIIGASATGLKDLKVTPIGENTAGPYLHISAISNVLSGHPVRRLNTAAESALLALTAVLIILATLGFKHGYLKNLTGLVILLAAGASGFLLYRESGLMLDLSTLLATALLAYLGSVLFLSLTEGAEKNRVSQAMGKYLAPSVMKEVLDRYDELGGEVGATREISILFSDIRSFTSISESMPAEKVVEILNTYLAAMIDIVFEYRGTLDKMIGDAIMAFWGAPANEPDKERLAVDTALKMQARMADLNAEHAGEWGTEIRIGIGVNTGDMIIGNIGSEKRLDYTAIGDNVNLGARLESLTKYYKVPIIISETTYEKIRSDYACLFLDCVAVKGKAKGINIYFPLGPKSAPQYEIPAKARKDFETAFAQYADGAFDVAARQFVALAKDTPFLRGLCSLFLDRCKQMHKKRPETWNGVWQMDSK